jgi:hypothetical protein
MGAANFQTTGQGKTPAEAFYAAREHAAWESGHGGYTGTIAEKSEFVLAAKPARMSAARLVEAIETFPQAWYGEEPKAFAKRAAKWTAKYGAHRATIERLARIYEEKWGPCVAIELTGTEAAKARKASGAKRGTRFFVFVGMASC